MKNALSAFRMILAMTVLLGVVYPLAMTGISQVLFPEQANGLLVKDSTGQVRGSLLLAQEFKNEKYFWPRPSAIGYNPMPSGGSNLGPLSKDFQNAVNARQAQGLSEDLLFTSGSGLDPELSPSGVLAQVSRVSKARGVAENELQRLIDELKQGRQFGFLGEERVRILQLNLILDERYP